MRDVRKWVEQYGNPFLDRWDIQSGPFYARTLTNILIPQEEMIVGHDGTLFKAGKSGQQRLNGYVPNWDVFVKDGQVRWPFIARFRVLDSQNKFAIARDANGQPLEFHYLTAKERREHPRVDWAGRPIPKFKNEISLEEWLFSYKILQNQELLSFSLRVTFILAGLAPSIPNSPFFSSQTTLTAMASLDTFRRSIAFWMRVFLYTVILMPFL